MRKIQIVLLSCLLLLLQACGGDSAFEGPGSSNSVSEGTPVPVPEPSPPSPTCGPQCCKCCFDGKACGDTCIDPDERCSQPPGCACNAPTVVSENLVISKTLLTTYPNVPLVGIGKLQFVSGLKYKSGNEEGFVCDQGTYTYELDKPINFSVGNIRVAEISSISDKRNITLNDFSTNEILKVNAARLLITLDEDIDPYQQGISISSDTNRIAESIHLDMNGLADIDRNSDISSLLGLTTNTSNLVSFEYASDYLRYLFHINQDTSAIKTR